MRFYKFAIVLAGIIMILNLAGITTPVGGGIAKSLNLIDDSQNITIPQFKNSPLWSNSSATDSVKGLTYVLTIALAATIVLGAFGRAPDIRYVTAGFVFGITSLLAADLIALFLIVSQYDVWISRGLGLLIGGSLVGLFITAIQFWQGGD